MEKDIWLVTLFCHMWLWWTPVPRSYLCRCKFLIFFWFGYEPDSYPCFSQKEPQLPRLFATIYPSCLTVRVAKNDVLPSGYLNPGMKTLALLPAPIAVVTDTRHEQFSANEAKIRLPKSIVVIYTNLLHPSHVPSHARLSAKRTSRFSVESCTWKNIAGPKIFENSVAWHVTNMVQIQKFSDRLRAMIIGRLHDKKSRAR